MISRTSRNSKDLRELLSVTMSMGQSALGHGHVLCYAWAMAHGHVLCYAFEQEDAAEAAEAAEA